MLIALLLSACAPEETLVLGEGLDVPATEKIYRGSDPTKKYHDAVVALHQRSRRSVYTTPFCTGTLIGEDWVLTAAHCVTTGSGGTMSASKIAIYVGDDPSVDLASNLYYVSAVTRHASYSDTTMYNDIAVLELSTPVTSVDPVPYLPNSLKLSSADVGDDVNFSGFGYDESGDYGVKQQVSLPIDGFGCSVSGCADAGSTRKQFAYEQDDSGGTGPCTGDSGGPAIMVRSGDPYVVGITSYGDSRCRVYGVSTRVDAYATWINTQTGL